MNQGFFDDEEKAISRGDEKPKRQKKELNYVCGEDCRLNKKCASPRIPLFGKGKLEILIVGKAPSLDDDKHGIVFSGEDGALLKETLDEIGLDFKQDFWSTNAVLCRPPKGRAPTVIEVSACRKYLSEIIKEKKPKGIILLGGTAVDSVIGPRTTGRIRNVNFSDYFGERIPDQDLGCWVFPVIHPFDAVAEMSKKASKANLAMVRVFKRQLKIAVKTSKKAFYEHNYTSDVFTTTDEQEAISWVDRLRKDGKNKYVAYDFETTGLKPHRKEQKIFYVGISDGAFGFGFPFFESDAFQNAWRKFLRDPRVGKIAHHANMEIQWSKAKSGVYPRGPIYDTSIGSRVENNKKSAGLKFQTYAKFGVIGYDDGIDEYIRRLHPSEPPGMKKSANRLNCMHEAPRDEALIYVGLDALFTAKLKAHQDIVIREARPGLTFFNDAVPWLTRASDNGIRVDVLKMAASEDRIEKKLRRLNKSISTHPATKLWDGSKSFNFNSDTQLSHLLFDILGMKPKGRTPNGAASVKADYLKKMDTGEYGDFVKKILEYKRWNKAQGTYLGQYKREMIDFLLHVFFNLDITDTFRSSADSPNFQNVPKHDKQVMAMLRGFIVPRIGNALAEWDYKGAEVTTAACVTGDPVLIANVTDSKNDMHRDCAADLFLRSKGEVTKAERYAAKNKYVFRTFYGGYFEQSAPELWDEMPEETKAHIKSEGIKTLKDYTGHVEECERKFWDETFVAYRDWKKWIWKSYNKKGYVDLNTGFRCYAPMTRNQVTNYLIQGPAFHILLWSFTELMKYLEEEENAERFANSFILGQIHDAVVGDIAPENEAEMDHLVWDFGTQKVREHWDWISVPLNIEKERSEIDGSWAVMNDCGFLKG